ncbi:hypothetical protein AVE30378_02191 [Achromobacter veterisilvae]|uniref:Uncharacterized protein n=1 Tax=Achromobacter veterisilvae TaxID=2069367 RepID=A0A446CFN9_9BURK|nr:hypothetical protein [Achromobacter veterisilvae]SSW66652.1 hypothetical protein AVE30378_02191 [Achromobacter veterisilvae]
MISVINLIKEREMAVQNGGDVGTLESLRDAIERGLIPSTVTSVEEANYFLQSKLINDRLEAIEIDIDKIVMSPVAKSDHTNPAFAALMQEKARLLRDSDHLNMSWASKVTGISR